MLSITILSFSIVHFTVQASGGARIFHNHSCCSFAAFLELRKAFQIIVSEFCAAAIDLFSHNFDFIEFLEGNKSLAGSPLSDNPFV